MAAVSVEVMRSPRLLNPCRGAISYRSFDFHCKCQVCKGETEVRGEGPDAWTHSNLNAAEVSVTRWLVCGYRTDWDPMFLGCSNPSTSSPRTSLVFLPRLPDWASTMCFTLVPTRSRRYFTDQRSLYALTFRKIILMKQSPLSSAKCEGIFGLIIVYINVHQHTHNLKVHVKTSAVPARWHVSLLPEDAG